MSEKSITEQSDAAQIEKMLANSGYSEKAIGTLSTSLTWEQHPECGSGEWNDGIVRGHHERLHKS